MTPLVVAGPKQGWLIQAYSMSRGREEDRLGLFCTQAFINGSIKALHKSRRNS
jgi:hypothetical protein